MQQDESTSSRHRPTDILINYSDQDEQLIQRNSQDSASSGLNSLSSSQGARKFLKHRLFDIGQLRNTSRFKSCKGDAKSEKSESDGEISFSQTVSNFNSEKSKFSKSRYLPTARLYGGLQRGMPDGQERSVSPPEVGDYKDP